MHVRLWAPGERFLSFTSELITSVSRQTTAPRRALSYGCSLPSQKPLCQPQGARQRADTLMGSSIDNKKLISICSQSQPVTGGRDQGRPDRENKETHSVYSFICLFFFPFYSLLQSQTALGLIGKSEADILNQLPCGVQRR